MYVLTNNSNVVKYPYSINDLKNDNPNVSFTNNPSLEFLSGWGVYPVVMTSATFDSKTQVATIDGCIYNKTKKRWETSWSVRDKTQEELDEYRQEIIELFAQLTQNRLDNFAKTRNYDDIKSACGYAGCSVARFNIEGTYCRDKRAETWEKIYNILNEVDSGIRSIPESYQEIENELPPLQWPN